MNHVIYQDKGLLLFGPSLSSGAVVLTVATSESPTAPIATPGSSDHVIDRCDRDIVNTVSIRVKDAAGYTTQVFTSGVSGQWPRLPSVSPTYSEKSFAVPLAAQAEEVVTIVICLVDPASGAETRRSQVVVIKHVPA
jgi:hypothetical protein